MHRSLPLLAALLVLPSLVVAQPAPGCLPTQEQCLNDATLGLHAVPRSPGPGGGGSPGSCATAPTSFACDAPGMTSTFAVQAAVHEGYDLYLVAADIDPLRGLQSIELGLEITGSVFSTWTLCADGEAQAGGWPATGGGNVISWNTCQATTPDPGDPQGGAVAIAGFFYVYAYGDAEFRVKPGSVVPVKVSLLDCLGSELSPNRTQFGAVGFGSGTGVQPCFQNPIPTPVDCSTDPSLTAPVCCNDGACMWLDCQHTRVQCEALGGTWIEDVPCSELNTVCSTVPVEMRSWGAIKSTFGSGD